MLLIFSFSILSITQNTNNILISANDTTSITLISVGDIFIHESVLDAVFDDKTGNYDFASCFQKVAPYLQNADIATAWFGGVLDSVGEYFGYPSFKTPEALALAMQRAGFDIVFRTNHTMDYGVKGLKTTSIILQKYSLEQIGAYLTEQESKNIYVYQKNNLKIAFLSYTYGMNDIPVPYPWMVNFIDTVKIKKDISEAKKISDFVVVALHFGTEYERYPNNEQKKIVHAITLAGADMIIGSHPHVIQPVDKVNNIYVAYCLGNFLCGQRMRYCDTGVMIKYTITKQKDNVYLKQISYIPTWTAKYWQKDNYKFQILPITKSTVINKVNYEFLSDDNLKRMEQAFLETVEHIERPEINFICEE